MTYEEVKEIKRRLELLEASTLSFDVRLDSSGTWEHPEFYYFHVQIKMGDEDNEYVLVKLFINENPEVEEIRLEKSDSRFIDDEYLQEQQEFYDACKLIVSAYLNDNLLYNEAEKWTIWT